MLPVRWLRNFFQLKPRRILYMLVLFLGLYIILVLVFKVKGLRSTRRVNEAIVIPKTNARTFPPDKVFRHENQDDFKRMTRPRNSSVSGCLNLHTWVFTCEMSVEKLVEDPLFPISPNAQTFVDNLELKWNEPKGKDVKDFGRRIFGFITVPDTGNYTFSLVTSSNAELWLSTNEKWENVRLLFKNGNYNPSRTSWFQKENVLTQETSSRFYTSEIQLKRNQLYYLEILQTKVSKDILHLTWKRPDSKRFEDISKNYLYSFMKESLEFKKFIKVIPFTLATNSYINSHPRLSILSSSKRFLSGIKYAEWRDVQMALPMCSYKPGYIGKRVLYEYHVVERLVNPSYVYPEVKHPNIKDGKWIPWFPLSEKEAGNIVGKYMKHLGNAYPGKYELKEILNVEKKPDWYKENEVFYEGNLKKGERFFLELLLWNHTGQQEVILSEYIYQQEKSENLCYPEGMQWNKTAPVYLLISARKQAAWLWHFVRNLEQLYRMTSDENLHVIMYDYNSTDIDIEAEFKKSLFKNCKILKNPDSKYSRTYSLNRAAEAVRDPNAIIFTLDLHLQIPPSFPNNVRKHSIKGKMVFTPIITRLSCGASPRYPTGGWDAWGYGMFAGYKSDWNNFKGFDEVKFKTKWGGEDWDLVTRVYKTGLEFERIKHADFYHYFHSKAGMWV